MSPVSVDKAKYIEHHVSKMDTLAGIAIKYGVEVADIRKLNNLATDLQIFALEKLLIPLPGRHPPSPVLSNGSANLYNGSASPRENGTTKRSRRVGRSNILEFMQALSSESPKQKCSPAMSTLQEYYHLDSPNSPVPNGAAEGTEMALYKTSVSDYFSDALLQKTSPFSDMLCSCRLKSQKSVEDLFDENIAKGDYVPLGENIDGENEKSNEKSVRRRQKMEADSRGSSSERLSKEENNGGSNGFSPSSGKCLAMRTKSASRTSLSSDSESGLVNTIPVGLGDSLLTGGLSEGRKSPSSSSLQDQDRGGSLSFWPTAKWSLKPELQALSTSAIARPFFDGLPIPITGRRKAALD